MIWVNLGASRSHTYENRSEKSGESGRAWEETLLYCTYPQSGGGRPHRCECGPVAEPGASDISSSRGLVGA